MNIQPSIQTDFYKTNHAPMYSPGMVKLYSNMTPRKSRFSQIRAITWFGLQYFILEYLISQWNAFFFKIDKDAAIPRFKRLMDYTLGKDVVDMIYMERLHDLGYLPLKIKSLPEGTLCPIGVPAMTITNTHDDFGWLVNYLETIISCTVWQPTTSATIAYEYKKLLTRFALETTGSDAPVPWQGHDFSMRGMSSLESACTSGAGHLLSFTGTDTIPAIAFLEQYYGADIEKELVGASVPATEHSVMCMGMKEGEIETFIRLLNLYPNGILSIVSDTWDLWKVLTEYLPELKERILARNGKLVIRPDSGDPVDIICGTGETITLNFGKGDFEKTSSMGKGVVELLWDVFGGTINAQGYKELDPHVGAIYGDSITLARAEAICERLKQKGFASTNIVFGIGSYTYQNNTRDTFGFAIKATYGEVETGWRDHGTSSRECREIFKDPITDDGTKRSAKGLLRVDRVNGILVLRDQVTKEEEEGGELQVVFQDGKVTRLQTLAEIRQRLSETTLSTLNEKYEQV